MAEPIPVHPVQATRGYGHPPAECPQSVTLRAYEVYKALYGEQQALITNECRGGFSTGELIAFLYARSFPREEWRQREEEAFNGMKGL